MVTRNTQSRLRIRGDEMTYMDLDKYVPSMDMLDEYEPIEEKGTFKSDDEIGWFFNEVKKIQNDLSRFKSNL